MSTALPRPHFDSTSAYAAAFTDAIYWRPYIAAICARHSLSTEPEISVGLAGTNPVFLIDRRYVVKLYTELFSGADSFARELACYTLLSQQRELAVPSLIVQGRLFDDDWPWPYLVISAIRGSSYGAIDAQTTVDRPHVADWLGALCRQLHALPVLPTGPLEPTWDAWLTFLSERRAACVSNHRMWRTLPDHLIEQIESYLPPIEALIDSTRPPCLLHGDLNADHLLGEVHNGVWQPTGVIDFGDARIGDPCYEFLALHLGLFGGDTTLLQHFLRSYGFPSAHEHNLAQRAMSYTLLHEFNVLAAVREQLAQAAPIHDLDQLARLLWTVDQPS